MKSMKTSILGMGISLIMLGSCATRETQSVLTLSGLNPANFETLIDGVKPVKLYTLKNANGMEICVTNFGGRLVSVLSLIHI